MEGWLYGHLTYEAVVRGDGWTLYADLFGGFELALESTSIISWDEATVIAALMPPSLAPRWHGGFSLTREQAKAITGGADVRQALLPALYPRRLSETELAR